MCDLGAAALAKVPKMNSLRLQSTAVMKPLNVAKTNTAVRIFIL